MADNLPFVIQDRLRLKSIKLAGFKSFVDPTTVLFTTNLVGVVGPNGCGKSNIIDAVRWVMGESSAKNLRGEAGVDVIFNGSTARQPVGQASVELLFDNPNGALGGEFARYSEISIRRLINRDGQSTYYLNGTHCRRRDIIDIFLGTGLGPRSYSIIEQGMISRLIEARPEELRIYLEEAAGISKYKERRRETENRIRHTHENLERLADIRQELDKQLERLKRQSESAIKYKEWQAEENTLRIQLLALRWQTLEAKRVLVQEQITEQEIAFEALVAELRHAELGVEQLQQQRLEVNATWQNAQQQVYGIGAQISRFEQNLQHIKERTQELQRDKLQAQTSLEQNEQHQQLDKSRIAEVESLLQAIAPEMEMTDNLFDQSAERLFEAEQAMNSWQSEWDNFNQHATHSSQQAQIEQTRIQHFEQEIQRLIQRKEKLQQEQTSMPVEADDTRILLAEQIAEVQLEQESAQQAFELANTAILETRQQWQQKQQQREVLHHERNKLEGRRASLEALQQAALGKGSKNLQQWLARHQLLNQPRLAEKLAVESGWEKAIETVLGHALQAICVDDIEPVTALLASVEQGSVMLVNQRQKANANTINSSTADPALLIHKVRSDLPLFSLFNLVYTASDLASALTLLPTLPETASVITPEGIWLSREWSRVWRDKDEHAGILQRQQEIEQLNREIENNERALAAIEKAVEEATESLQKQEQVKDTEQKQLTQLASRLAMLQAEQRVRQNRFEQQQIRQQQIYQGIEEIELAQQEAFEQLQETRKVWQSALVNMESDAKTREILQSKREALRTALEQIKAAHRENNDKMQHLALQQKTLQAEMQMKQQNLLRAEQQIQAMRERCEQVAEALLTIGLPLEEINEQLAAALEQRLLAEEKLQLVKSSLDDLDEQIRQKEIQRQQGNHQINLRRGQLEQLRLTYQSEEVRQQTILEQTQAMGVVIAEVVASLPSDATESKWESVLEGIQTRIQRLGAINLAAIEEFSTESERKQYLDAQHADLTEALGILDEAIQKIDKETRAKFKETFEIVNESFQALFPKVFGGGSAYLELTSDNLLDTGVTVMARPPGKKNSTIHLLSGGEKALTAIALIFSIFQLNPAPFCLLDEVDAPLDDANVGRYCHLIKEMSQTVQFIFISHNKLAMEMADCLVGVTMKEPGVSRLVSVNIEEAVAMAES